jgi:Zn-dependent protease
MAAGKPHVSIEVNLPMTLQHVDILFQLIVFLFAISIHESAHAWMANRCGDPTARMLGRITLNPIKHIDLFGTVILPLIALISHFPVLGWAKPTPVNPRNFKNPTRDDILTSVVGPISNFIVVIGAVIVLILIATTSQLGGAIVRAIPYAYPNQLNELGAQTGSVLLPLSLLFYDLMTINIVLAIFNLIPLPPLDGSHVLRHFLSGPALQAYDRVGWIGLMLLVYLGGGLLGKLIYSVIGFFDSILMRV